MLLSPLWRASSTYSRKKEKKRKKEKEKQREKGRKGEASDADRFGIDSDSGFV